MGLFYPPRPAIRDPALTSEALIDELELAVKPYIGVNYDLALIQLTNALARADGNYGLIVRDPKAKDAMTRAQVALALTYRKMAEKIAEEIAKITKKIKDNPDDAQLVATKKELVAKKKELEPKAVEAMTAYIRSSPDPVVRRMFGPPGEELYNEVRRTLDSVKRANVAISVAEPDAQLFLNGVLVGRGATFTGAQLPGPYCIIVRVGRDMLRYDVVMDEEQRVTLNIDWAIDSIFNVSDQWVGLVPTTGAPANYVRSLALRMGGQIAIIFVGLRRERDYLAVYGYYFDHAYRGGEYLLRSGEVHVAGARDEVRLRDLVRFVATGKHSASILPIGTVARAPSAPVSRSRPWLERRSVRNVDHPDHLRGYDRRGSTWRGSA